MTGRGFVVFLRYPALLEGSEEAGNCDLRTELELATPYVRLDHLAEVDEQRKGSEHALDGYSAVASELHCSLYFLWQSLGWIEIYLGEMPMLDRSRQ